MEPKRAKQQRVGVRELRQNLSVYLARVKQGERLEVTEHGRLVAVLAPPPRQDTWLEQAIADGRVTPPTRDLRDLPPPLPSRPGSKPLSQIIIEMREEDPR